MLSKKSILILGGYGKSGLAMAKLLLRESEHHIGLAGREQAKADRHARALNWEHSCGRVHGVQVNLGLRKQLTAILGRYDLVIDNIKETAFPMQAAQAALDAGIDYLDLTGNEEKLLTLKGLDGDAQAAGLTFIGGAGLVPGAPRLAARHLADHLDSFHGTTIDCQLQERSFRDKIHGDVFPDFEDNKAAVTGLSLGAFMERGANWMRKILPGKESIQDKSQLFAVRATAAGVLKGRRESLRLTLTHRDPGQATAMSTLPAILGILDGTIRPAGVHMMENVLDPEGYMEELWNMGMAITIEGLPESLHELDQPSRSMSRDLIPDIPGIVSLVA